MTLKCAAFPARRSGMKMRIRFTTSSHEWSPLPRIERRRWMTGVTWPSRSPGCRPPRSWSVVRSAWISAALNQRPGSS